jgi:hypothetical protein
MKIFNHKETCTHKIDIKEKNMISKIKSCKILIRFFLKHGQRLKLILLYVDELQPQRRQIHHKYQQGKKDSCDALIKATSNIKRILHKRTKKFKFMNIAHVSFLRN